jgi:hypothetical protein
MGRSGILALSAVDESAFVKQPPAPDAGQRLYHLTMTR